MKLRRRVLVSIILSLVLVATVLLGAVNVLAERPTTSIGEIVIVKSSHPLNDANKYGTYYYGTGSGHVAVCVEPKNGAPEGTYKYGERTDANAKYIIACLLTAPISGKGAEITLNKTGTDANPVGSYQDEEMYREYYEKLVMTDKGQILEDQYDIYYHIAHFVCSYLDGKVRNDTYKTIYGGTVSAVEKKVKAWADANPEIIKQYKLYATMPEDGSDKQSVVWLEKKPNNGGAKIVKTAAAVNGEDITKGNNCYGNLGDATYGIYKDKACTSSVGTLNANGAAINIAEGTYWVKETKAPVGYEKDSTVYETVVKQNETATVNVKDVPIMAPLKTKILQKQKKDGSKTPDLAGAEYKFSYYAGKYTKDNLPAKATREWVMKTDTNGEILFDDKHKVSGDAFYKTNNGEVAFPLGTVKIVETKAPAGFTLDTEVKIIDVGTFKDQDPKERAVISIEKGKGAVAIKKINESGDALPGVKIGIYSDPEAKNLIEELITNENGIAYYGYDENAVGSDKFKLTPGTTYYFKEIEAPKMDEDGNEYYLSEEIVPVTVVEPKNVENGIAEGNIAYGELENFFRERLKTKAFFDNGVKEGIPAPETKIIDQVECINLKEGKEYTIKGALYDVENPENVLATGETTFTATAKNMFVEVEFLLDASELEGKTVVVFEDLYKDEIKVATHSELTDKEQQVSFPKIVTSVGESTITADMDATITDTLSYTNLTPGKNYVIEGVIMDKDTGEIALSNGEEIRATAVLTPETENGQADVVFAFDASQMAGKTLVVFEEVYDEDAGELIGEHKDLNDKNQTFTVVDGPAENITTNLENDDDGTLPYNSPLTGDENKELTWLLLGITAVMLAISCAAVMRRQRRKEY